MNENEMTPNSQFIIDEFMRDFSRNELIASINANCECDDHNDDIDDCIIDFIDAQFDDEFAIIFDDDANANSIDMIIESMRIDRDIIANELRNRIYAMIES